MKKLGYEEILFGEDVIDLESRMGLPSQEELDEAYENALVNGANEEYAKLTKAFS